MSSEGNAIADVDAAVKTSVVSYKLAASALVRIYMASGRMNDRDDKMIASLAEMCSSGSSEVAAAALGRIGYILNPLRASNVGGVPDGGGCAIYSSLQSDDPDLVWAAISMLKAVVSNGNGLTMGPEDWVDAMNNMVVKHAQKAARDEGRAFDRDGCISRWNAYKASRMSDPKTFEPGGALFKDPKWDKGLSESSVAFPTLERDFDWCEFIQAHGSSMSPV